MYTTKQYQLFKNIMLVYSSGYQKIKLVIDKK